MFPECSLNVPWMFPECSLIVPWLFPDYIGGIDTRVGEYIGMATDDALLFNFIVSVLLLYKRERSSTLGLIREAIYEGDSSTQLKAEVNLRDARDPLHKMRGGKINIGDKLLAEACSLQIVTLLQTEQPISHVSLLSSIGTESIAHVYTTRFGCVQGRLPFAICVLIDCFCLCLFLQELPVLRQPEQCWNDYQHPNGRCEFATAEGNPKP
jgi:hypothetical protein